MNRPTSKADVQMVFPFHMVNPEMVYTQEVNRLGKLYLYT